MRVLMGLFAVMMFLQACSGEQRRDQAFQAQDFNAPDLYLGQCPRDENVLAGGECGLFRVPLNWDSAEAIESNSNESGSNESSEKVSDAQELVVFLRRYRTDGSSKGQIWFLDGGPGGANLGPARASFVNEFTQRGYDLYLLSHRGTQPSTALTCEAAQHSAMTFGTTGTAQCAPQLYEAWGNDLVWFSTAGATQDLHYLIERFGENAASVYLIGASYGALLAEVFLQEFHEQLDGLILLSGLPLNYPYYYFERDAETTFREFIALCDEQPECAEYFPEGISTSLAAILYPNILDSNTPVCTLDSFQLSPAYLRSSLQFVAMRRETRTLLPSIVARLGRCNSEDKLALNTLFTVLAETRQQQNQARAMQAFNPVLHVHQVLTEFIPADAEQHWPTLDTSLFINSEREAILSSKALWPVTQPVQPASLELIDTPVLILHGALDFQAPGGMLEAYQQRFNKEMHYLITFPYAGHGTPEYSQLGESNCSYAILEDFLSMPASAPPTECVEALSAINFSDNPQVESGLTLSQKYYGRDSLWE